MNLIYFNYNTLRSIPRFFGIIIRWI